MIFDLHSHTTASDGILTPTELVHHAVSRNIDYLAITDHDTIKGISQAQETIQTDNLPLRLVTGVEISTLWKNYEIHIVGLNIEIESKALITLLKMQEENRLNRATAIGEKLARVSVNNAYEGAKQYAKGDIVSRAHFARYLVEKGYAKNIKAAFKKYLAKSGYAYVPAKWCSIEEAIKSIHAANGIAILAHPSRYDLTATKLNLLLSEFKAWGGEGMEVSQSRQTIDDLRNLANLANRYQLLASQGSDFHDLKNYLDLGKTNPLPDSVQPVWHNWF